MRAASNAAALAAHRIARIRHQTRQRGTRTRTMTWWRGTAPCACASKRQAAWRNIVGARSGICCGAYQAREKHRDIISSAARINIAARLSMASASRIARISYRARS